MSKEANKSKKVCFVIGSIGDPGTEIRRHADWLLEAIIEPVFEAHFQEFTVTRSDKISAPGSISSQIINLLHTAELVIADMSRENANAFYEMGIRHMKRLPTIHMYSEGQNIPFDVKPYRAIPWKYAEPKDLKAAQAALKAAIKEVIVPGFVVDNPVTQARGVEKLEETATPEQRVLFDQVQQLQKRLDDLEDTRRFSVGVPGPEQLRTDRNYANYARALLERFASTPQITNIRVDFDRNADREHLTNRIRDLFPNSGFASEGTTAILTLSADSDGLRRAIIAIAALGGVKDVAVVG